MLFANLPTSATPTKATLATRDVGRSAADRCRTRQGKEHGVVCLDPSEAKSLSAVTLEPVPFFVRVSVSKKLRAEAEHLAAERGTDVTEDVVGKSPRGSRQALANAPRPAAKQPPGQRKLANVDTDVLVIGGGIAGLLAAAKNLADAGLSAVVLEKRDVNGGKLSSWRDGNMVFAGGPEEGCTRSSAAATSCRRC